jgi:IS30 family transposase
MAWSPEQIANRLEVDFPDDESMRISHEAIYQALFIESRGALKRASCSPVCAPAGRCGSPVLARGGKRGPMSRQR